MKYRELNLGQVEAIVNKLGGMKGVRRFLSDETVVKAIEKTFPIWKTIKLGTGLKTADDFRKALQQSGCKIGTWGSGILGEPAFTASDTETEVDLANVSVAELGFKEGARRKDIYERAISLGLELCPNEVGPQLRLQYKDQPSGEWLRIAMEPISDSDGYLGIFEVERGDDDLWLYGNDGDSDAFWHDRSRFVFVRPRKLLHFSPYLTGEFCF